MYDFDYSSIIEVEYHQLKRVRDSIAKYHNHVNAEYDISRMDIMLRLLDIIRNEGGWHTENGKYVPDSYTNPRNAYRFSKHIAEKLPTDDSGLWLTYLREEKVWSLYNKMHKQYLRNFWD